MKTFIVEEVDDKIKVLDSYTKMSTVFFSRFLNVLKKLFAL